MNRRGQTGYFPRFIVRTMVLICAVAILIMLTLLLTQREIDSRVAEASVTWTRLLYTPGGLFLTDPTTGRVYPGLLAPDGFERVGEVYQAQSPHGATSARLTLLDEHGDAIRQRIINPDGWRRHSSMAAAGVGGPGGATLFVRNYTISYDAQGPKRGILEMEVVVPHGLAK